MTETPMANDQKDTLRDRLDAIALERANMDPADYPELQDIAYLSASTPAKPVGELVELIGQYWDLAYAEGWAGRDHDTPSDDAQRVLSTITSALTTLAAERDAAREYAAASTTAKLEGANSVLLAQITASQAQVATLTAALEEFGSSRVRDRIAAKVGCNHDLLHDALQDEVRAALNPKPSQQDDNKGSEI